MAPPLSAFHDADGIRCTRPESELVGQTAEPEGVWFLGYGIPVLGRDPANDPGVGAIPDCGETESCT
jgi:hypothetical protein